MTGLYSRNIKIGLHGAETNVRIHHLRTAGGREVDIVLERGDGSVCGIEVKLGATALTRLRSASSTSRASWARGSSWVPSYTRAAETLRFGPGLWALPISALWTK
jgi:predicted RecB family endonuclease